MHKLFLSLLLLTPGLIAMQDESRKEVEAVLARINSSEYQLKLAQAEQELQALKDGLQKARLVRIAAEKEAGSVGKDLQRLRAQQK